MAHFVSETVISATIDGVELFIPVTETNRHYRELLERVAAGTETLEPWSEPMPTAADLTAAINEHVEAQARSMDYNSAAALAGYATSTIPAWAAQATAFIAWRDAVWLTAYELLEQHTQAGTVPTEAEVLEALPEFSAE